jgi:GNAT superfamily N-acetyltransferase
MKLEWVHENPPHWDEPKARIVGGAPRGTFAHVETYRPGDLLPGEWWRAEDGGSAAGYGWLDCTWGDAEILLAVDPDRQRGGVGTFILDRLEHEAASRGVNYMYNVVRTGHPDRAGVIAWLRRRGFAPAHDEERLQRRVR